MIEADEETLPYTEEDWQDPEQMEVSKNLEPDLRYRLDRVTGQDSRKNTMLKEMTSYWTEYI